MVFINIESNGNTTIYGGSWNNIGAIPESYRCSYTVDFAVSNRSAGTAIWGQVDKTTGIVRIYIDSGNTAYYLGSVCYIIDQ